MTITFNDTYTNLTISSEYLDSAASLTFNYKRNCASTLEEVILTAELSEVDGGTLLLSSEEVFETEIPQDGVYYFETVIVDEASDTHREWYCMYVGPLTRCQAQVKAEDTGNDIVLYVIEALEVANDCDCDCDKMCDLYEYLTAFINQTVTADVSSCSSC